MICLDDEYDFTYHIAEITYTEWEDESYLYEIVPNYSVISLLPSKLFQGIPGLDLDQRKDVYVRKNMVPVFISERTPDENREDLWELLESCNMEYLNRLEWLIRTNTRYSGDYLYVCRKDIQDLKFDNLTELGSRSAVICRKVLEVICMGGTVTTKDFTIDDHNRKSYYELFLSIYKTERTYLDEKRKTGIKKAAEDGAYRGRERTKLDSLKLQEMFYAYEKGKITGEQAAERLNISRSTFLRRYKEFKGV